MKLCTEEHWRTGWIKVGNSRSHGVWQDARAVSVILMRRQGQKGSEEGGHVTNSILASATLSYIPAFFLFLRKDFPKFSRVALNMQSSHLLPSSCNCKPYVTKPLLPLD